jgi:prophage regulatory protein
MGETVSHSNLCTMGNGKMTDPVLISMNDACALTSLSRTAINKRRSVGQFPAAVSLGDKRVAFVRAEVIAWVERRIAERKAA